MVKDFALDSMLDEIGGGLSYSPAECGALIEDANAQLNNVTEDVSKVVFSDGFAEHSYATARIWPGVASEVDFELFREVAANCPVFDLTSKDGSFQMTYGSFFVDAPHGDDVYGQVVARQVTEGATAYLTSVYSKADSDLIIVFTGLDKGNRASSRS